MTTGASPAAGDVREAIRQELEAARSAFHALLASLSDEDWRRPSHTPGWSNRALAFHMVFGFFLLPVLVPFVRVAGRLPRGVSKPPALLLNTCTIPFNWLNAVGPRVRGRMYTRQSLGRTYDWVNGLVLRLLDSVGEDEWGRGIYAPTKWDVLFPEYMTLEQLFRYPALHLRSHLTQIAR